MLLAFQKTFQRLFVRRHFEKVTRPLLAQVVKEAMALAAQIRAVADARLDVHRGIFPRGVFTDLEALLKIVRTIDLHACL